jgi:hypothetical protein
LPKAFPVELVVVVVLGFVGCSAVSKFLTFTQIAAFWPGGPA